MALSSRAPVKAALIALLLCAVAFAQFAALSDTHTPHFANDHCCLLCHIGVLPFLHPDSALSAGPTTLGEWLPFNPGCSFCQDVQLVSRSSRAPPTSFLHLQS